MIYIPSYQLINFPSWLSRRKVNTIDGIVMISRLSKQVNGLPNPPFDYQKISLLGSSFWLQYYYCTSGDKVIRL
jgi:hypothetical protein